MMVIKQRKEFLLDAKKSAEERIKQIKTLLKDFSTYKKEKCLKWNEVEKRK
jgi:hypothetical protein